MELSSVMSADEMSNAFAVASSALRVKRRTLSKELSAFLQLAVSDSPPTLEAFNERKEYFENLWETVVTTTKECLDLIDEGEDPDGKEAERLNDTLEDLRYKKDRLIYLEEDYARKSLNMDDVKNIIPNVIASSSIDKTAEPVVEASETGDLTSKNINSNVDQVVEKSESSEGELSEPDESDLKLKQELHEIKESDVSLVEKISQLFNVQTQGLRMDLSGNMNTIHESNESLNRCVDKLSESIEEVRSNVIDLRSENESMKRELESSVHASEKKMTDKLSSNNKAVMTRIDKLNERVANVESVIMPVPKSIDVVSESVEKNSVDLNRIDTQVIPNS